MAHFKRYEKEPETCEFCTSLKMRLFSLFLMIVGPIFLIFINLRCEKNQCVLLQFPMVVPTHLSAYFSLTSALVLASFLALMFLVGKLNSSRETKRGKIKVSEPGFSGVVSPTLICMLCLSMLMACVAYLKPDYIMALRAEYLRLLSTATAFSLIFAFVLALLCRGRYFRKDRDYCFPLGFFHGYSTRIKCSNVDMKYYFYVNVGLVAWALLDLLIFISFVLEQPVTAPLLFIFTTQYILIMHTLLYEKFLSERPFMFTEGLGFFWLMRVLLYTPFLFSLPLLYTSVTEWTIPKPAMLANCGLFMFGFVIYVSSLHQRESFSVNPTSYRSLKSTTTSTGRRLLVGGYWGTVQKPDYLGYLIMWVSWTVASGLSLVSVIVFSIVFATVMFWLTQRNQFHKERYGTAWTRYTAQVPHKIIPLVY